MNDLDIDPIKQELIGETSKIAWKELQVFFAGGTAVYISDELDLITVASCFVEDNKVMVEKWMHDRQVMPVSDDQARNWYNENATVWAVVVRPWVLVQPVKE